MGATRTWRMNRLGAAHLVPQSVFEILHRHGQEGGGGHERCYHAWTIAWCVFIYVHQIMSDLSCLFFNCLYMRTSRHRDVFFPAQF